MATTGVELATAYVTLAVSTKGVERDVRRMFGGVERNASATGRNAGRAMGGGLLASAKSFAGPLAAAFGIGIIAKQISSAVTAGSDFQQAVGGADAVFKKEATGIKKSADNAAGALGLSKVAYLELATVVGAGLKNKGVKDFAKQSGDLIKIGADLSAQFGGSTTDAVNAIASAMRGESDPIERYGVSLNETAINAKLVEQGVKKVNGKYTEQQKTAARLAIITQQTADAQGAFARESNTLAGKQARLKATFENIRTEVGTALLPAFTSLADWFLKKGVPAVKGFADFVTKRLVPGIEGLKDLIVGGDFTKALSDAFGWDEDSGPVNFILGVRDAFIRVKDTVSGLIELFSSGDFTGALAKGLGISDDSPVVGVLLGIRDGAIEAWARVKEVGGWIKDELWPVLKEGYEEIVPSLKAAWDTITGAFGPGDGADVDWRKFGQVITDYVVPGLVFFANGVIPVVAANIRSLIEVVKVIAATFGIWRTVVENVTTFLVNAFANVTGFAADMLEALSVIPGFGWAKDAADKLREVADKADAVRDAINGIPTERKIQIIASVSMPGRITLPGGESVNIGLREKGGPVRAGQPYIVGEKRPELFVPNQSGTILPSVPGAAGASSSGAAYNFYGPIQASDPMELDRKLKERARFANLTGANR